MEDLYRLNPGLRDRFAADARAIVSEPPGEAAAGWTEIPQSTLVVIERGEIEKLPFAPRSPRRERCGPPSFSSQRFPASLPHPALERR
jgi:hypothetical protein